MSQNANTPGFRPGEDWPTIAELAKGYDEYLMPDSDKLSGRKLELIGQNKSHIQYHFVDKNTVTWNILKKGDSNIESGSSTEAKYRALELRENIFFIDFYKTADDEEVTIVLSLITGQAVTAISTFYDRNGAPRTQTTLVDSHLKEFESAKPFPVTEELLGKVVFYRYNARDCYEHSYQNPGTFAWHCLAGVEKGVASSDPCKFLKLDEELYFIYWTETVMPVESIVISDLKNLRSTGRFFCWDPKPRTPLHMVFGSYATVLADFSAKRKELLAKI